MDMPVLHSYLCSMEAKFCVGSKFRKQIFVQGSRKLLMQWRATDSKHERQESRFLPDCMLARISSCKCLSFGYQQVAQVVHQPYTLTRNGCRSDESAQLLSKMLPGVQMACAVQQQGRCVTLVNHMK